MRLAILLSMAVACFGQGRMNVVQTGTVDAHGANWIPPTSTFASPPSSPATGAEWTFTDASSAGTCAGTGTALAKCRWSGSAWQAVVGAGGGVPYTGATGDVDLGVHDLSVNRLNITGSGATWEFLAQGTCPAAADVTTAGYDYALCIQSGVLNQRASTALGGALTAIGGGSVPRTSCFDLGTDNASADLVDADIGPQGNVFKVPVAVTIIEATVSANAGTPKMPILQKNHWGGSSWAATDITSAALATGSAGIETCAATGSACISGVAKDGTVTITTAGSANVLAAGDWIQTKTGSGFASSGAKRLSVCLTWTVN